MIPYQQMFCLLDYRIVSHFTETCISLGVFDHLATHSLSVSELAKRTGTHQRSLHRCLRGLAHFDLFAIEPDANPSRSMVSLTDVSQYLVLNSEFSLRPWHHFCQLAQSRKHEQRRTLWKELLQTGKSIYQLGRDRLFYDYLQEHQDLATAFDQAMESMSRVEIRDILQGFDFSQSQKIAEIAGGNGALITGILQKYEGIQGQLFDVPDTISRVSGQPRLQAIGVDMRVTLPDIPGDSILKRILHSYSDEQALTILRNVRQAMHPGNKLYIFELIEDCQVRNPYIGIKNLQMLLVHGAPGESGGPGERTRYEFASLLHSAGFELVNIQPLPSIDAIVAVYP
ncbi:methyltransferase [Roseofilum sp. BLCC_M154]|uniref:Methyltransferase n=1 Tax=Roseofilum acuticapitatum BLCC-M154 TaxID=3022444 RepID=A0ABT7AWP5_9CYAN|nr:methyltransferase [Roseofilum acuticapitatum]MDJ1171290.1 methyltransferase [Roseofilum acuticapitatum BLCC-M154]